MNASDESELPDVGEVPASGARVLFAGLALGAGTMLVAEMFMVLVLRSPEVLLIGAPLTVAFILTAGLLVAVAVNRVTRGLGLRAASLIFCVAGFIAGALWGYPVFTIALNSAALTSEINASPAAAMVGAVYTGTTAGLGALAGRYFGPWAATRPSLLRTITLSVLTVAAIGVVLLSMVNLDNVA